MSKSVKIFFVILVLIVMAFPLGYLIKTNFEQRLANTDTQKIGSFFDLSAIEKARETVSLVEQTNEQLNEIVENPIIESPKEPVESEQENFASSSAQSILPEDLEDQGNSQSSDIPE